MGIRTCIFILLGSYIFTYISLNVGNDHSRVLAQIVSGVSFIGAGIIFKNGLSDIRNLTTAVLVWVLAALGILVALTFWLESLIITGVIYTTLIHKFK